MRWTAEVMATTPLLVAAVLVVVVMMPAAVSSITGAQFQQTNTFVDPRGFGLGPDHSISTRQRHHQHLHPAAAAAAAAASAGAGAGAGPPSALSHHSSSSNTNNINNPRPPSAQTPVTPMLGPILLKNDSMPVIPLFSYASVINGTFYQIPILWTALSVALGVDIRGDIIRGLPCVKMLHQLLCTRPGNTYPSHAIERFIDDNKALIRRMYGEFGSSADEPFSSSSSASSSFIRGKRDVFHSDFWRRQPHHHRHQEQDSSVSSSSLPAVPEDDVQHAGDWMMKTSSNASTPDIHQRARRAPATLMKTQQHHQRRRQQQQQQTAASSSSQQPPPPPPPSSDEDADSSHRADACQSKTEVVTPYWASNSAGKIRAIVNTQHFEQAIYQEICHTGRQTRHCAGGCSCEQKYKWHRLLAYDPDNDCAGIFMDWFLFPSCCVCRCDQHQQ